MRRIMPCKASLDIKIHAEDTWPEAVREHTRYVIVVTVEQTGKLLQ